MKKNWLKNAVIFLLTVLLLSGLILSASGSSTVYLMSVNDKVVEMTEDNMPLVSGSQLYIPYIMLSSQVTGINLGVRAHYNASRGDLTVTNGQQAVTFDTRKNTAHDAWGTALTARALVRDSMAYLPVQWLCNYFDEVSYSLTYTPYGTLVRLTNSAVVLNDTEFIDAADTQLRQNLQSYRNSLASSTPPPTVSTPTPTPPPTTQPDPEPAPLVYLAFRWDSRAEEIADFLEEEGLRALFLFDCDQLMRQDDLVRRLIGRGHQVGLTLVGSDPASWWSQLEYGRQLMNDISRGQLLIISADGLGESGRRALAEAGYAIWSADLQADELSLPALLRRLDPEGPNYVELTCDRAGLAVLAGLMPPLSRGELRLSLPLAPLL